MTCDRPKTHGPPRPAALVSPDPRPVAPRGTVAPTSARPASHPLLTADQERALATAIRAGRRARLLAQRHLAAHLRRERAILAARHGRDGQPPRTLQEIGRARGLIREEPDTDAVDALVSVAAPARYRTAWSASRQDAHRPRRASTGPDCALGYGACHSDGLTFPVHGDGGGLRGVTGLVVKHRRGGQGRHRRSGGGQLLRAGRAPPIIWRGRVPAPPEGHRAYDTQGERSSRMMGMMET